MTDEMTQDFRALAMAALKLTGSMLDSLEPEARIGIERALNGGSSLQLTFGPLPAFEKLAMELVEHEGTRTTVCTMTVLARPPLS